MKIQPVPQSQSDRFSHGADLWMVRAKFMTRAVLDLVAVFALATLLVWAAVAALTLGPARAHVCFAVLLAKLLPTGLGLALPCWLPTGVIWVGIATLRGQSLPLMLYVAGLLGAGSGVVAAAAARRWFLRTGEAVGQSEHLRGARVVETVDLQALIPNPGPLPAGDVRLPAGRETQGTFIAGSTGTGKTTLLIQRLRALCECGGKLIIYDPALEFITKFLRELYDIVLNIFDVRMLRWTFWAEIRRDYDYRALAESLIPPDVRYMGFVMQARTVLAALIKMTSSFAELRAALRLNLCEMEKFLVGTVAQGIISPENSRGSETVMSMIRNSLMFINYLEDPAPGEPVFSVRDWVRDDDDRRWIFIPAPEDQRPLLRPLIALWIDLVTLEILTLTPDPARRIWVILEELASLPPLAALHGLVTRGRKCGGCTVLVTQDPGQLAAIYGTELAHVLLQNLATWVLFRANNAQAAKFLADQVGQFEEIEKYQSISVGPGEADRDGASYTARRVTRPTLLPSELQTLPDLEAFLLLHGDYPRTRIRLTYQDLPEVAPAFLLNSKVVIRPKGVQGQALEGPESPLPEPPSEGAPLPEKAGKGKGKKFQPTLINFLEKLKN